MGSLAKYHIATRLPSPTSANPHPLPNQIYHISVMPCYDKKLEGSRPDFFSEEHSTRDVDCVLTTAEVERLWREVGCGDPEAQGVWEHVASDARVRMARGPEWFPEVPEGDLETAYGVRWRTAGGTSGGYLVHVVRAVLADVCGVRCDWSEVDQVGAGGGGNAKEWMVPEGNVDGWVAGKLRKTTANYAPPVKVESNGMDVDSSMNGHANGHANGNGQTTDNNHSSVDPPELLVIRLATVPSRNQDHLDWVITARPVSSPRATTLFKFAFSYGFRNIQNLVRKVPAAGVAGSAATARMRAKARIAARKKAAGNGGEVEVEEEEVGYTFVEVMACPSGCINGGGQLRPDPNPDGTAAPVNAREWISNSESKYREEYAELPELDLWENPAVDGVVKEWLGSLDSDKARRFLLTEYHAVDKVEVNALTVKW
ncbi:hypothetical protein HDU93_005997 [Gonapodya sp. JEL0774]|nr:hypothetical protein HDU93_005997 [Gonapodya sp. JEL0774]